MKTSYTNFSIPIPDIFLDFTFSFYGKDLRNRRDNQEESLEGFQHHCWTVDFVLLRLDLGFWFNLCPFSLEFIILVLYFKNIKNITLTLRIYFNRNKGHKLNISTYNFRTTRIRNQINIICQEIRIILMTFLM